MRSASRNGKLAVVGLCLTLGGGTLAGCSTTQEKATAQRAEAARILQARAKRQHRKHANGTKTDRRRSAYRQKGKG